MSRVATRRARQLHRGFARELRRRTGVRAGTAVAATVAVVAVVPTFVQAESTASAAPLIAKSLWAISILGVAPAAVSLAGHTHDAQDDLCQLAKLRGFDTRTIALARHAAAISTLLGVALLPVLALCVVASLASTSPSAALAHVVLAAPATLYALPLAITLGVLAGASARLVPEHGRFALVALLLVPELMKALWPSTPSVPAAFDWLLRMAFRSVAP